MEKVSVIVPIYNREKYVGQCIDSIVNQDYANLEIILVNDGSNDSSLRVCEDRARQDNRIRIVNEKNGGRGAARNRGIECSTGDYITFIDGDDFIDDDYVSNLVNQKKKYNSNIAITINKRFDQENGTFYVLLDPAPYDYSNDGLYSSESYFKKFLYAENDIIGTSCMKLYDRSLFKNIRFPERNNMSGDTRDTMCEDTYVSLKVAMTAQKISFENRPTYIYRVHSDGSITSEEGAKAFRYSQVRILEEYMSLLSVMGDKTRYHFDDLYISRLKSLADVAKSEGNEDTYNRTIFKLFLMQNNSNSAH